MSMKATHWVWEYSKSTGNSRLLILVLARVATKHGAGRLPPREDLIRWCHFSDQSELEAALITLTDLGEVVMSQLPRDEPSSRPWFTIKPLAVTHD